MINGYAELKKEQNFLPRPRKYNELSDLSAINHSPASRLPRENLLGVLLLITLWLTQIRYPPLSYPAIGLCVLTLVAAMAVLLPIKAFTRDRLSAAPLLRYPALLPGFGYLSWVIGRWAMAGFPPTGAAEVGTLLWAAVYFVIAFLLTPAHTPGADESDLPTLSLSAIFVYTLSGVGLACGLHAVWQFHFAYMDAYQSLLGSIGGRPPDRTEAALLHHLQLRRVASIWGDPNTLATFSAISICASLELLAARCRFIFPTRALALLSITACAAAIYYTGSRGGALDALAVIFIFGGFLLWFRRSKFKQTSAAAVIMVALGTLMAFPARTGAQADPSAPEAPRPEPSPSSWVWRSDTVRERIFYLRVGEKMIRMAPLVGLGPGSVEVYFGRLKPAEARETKYLHNWIVQTWAETGLVGLGLTTWFLVVIAWNIWRNRLWRRPFERALAVMFVLLIFDGLLQVSWNQRELMVSFGLICGVLTSRPGSLAPAVSRMPVLRVLRLSAFLGVASLFALHESRFLASATSKQIALDAMHAGERPEAIKQWARATRWMPLDAEPFAARASLAMEQGRLSAARMLIKKALELEPESASLHVQAATIHKAIRQDEEAYAHLTFALRLYPAHPEYNYLYAKETQSRGNLAEAAHYANLAVTYNYQPELLDRYEKLVAELKTASEITRNQ